LTLLSIRPPTRAKLPSLWAVEPGGRVHVGPDDASDEQSQRLP
jgi:hypothetical protein